MHLILLRVYDRLDDLRENIGIIRNNFAKDYEIFVVSNGEGVDQSTVSLVDYYLKLQTNQGHMKGSSQLLMQACRHINFDKYEFVVILEADTWLFDDKPIAKYQQILRQSGAVWASAKWYDRYVSLAVDFAIIKSEFLKHNVDIFDFEDFPECYVADYLAEKGCKFVYIKEGSPVMCPSYFKKYPFAPWGRFLAFPKLKMVTHHTELQKDGEQVKKSEFNKISKNKYFDGLVNKHKYSLFLRFLFVDIIFKLLPKRSWFGVKHKKVYKNRKFEI